MSRSKGAIATRMVMAAVMSGVYDHAIRVLLADPAPSEKEPSEPAKRAMISAQEKRIRKNQKRLTQKGGMT